MGNFLSRIVWIVAWRIRKIPPLEKWLLWVHLVGVMAGIPQIAELAIVSDTRTQIFFLKYLV